jgi:hypothetical protein
MGDAKKGIAHFIDSSIELKIELKKDKIEIRERKHLIGKISLDDFAIALWEAYQNLLNSLGMESAKDLGDMSEDLFLSALNFRVAFAHALRKD